MAELRRPSRLALVMIAIILPAVMGWVCRGLVASTAAPTATGVVIELPTAPAASLVKTVHSDA